MVALAGPATNFILAIIGILVILIYTKIMGGTPNDIFLNTTDLMINFWIQFSFLNIALALFNLIPLAPLDGYRLIKIWRHQGAEFMEKYAHFFLILVVLLVFLASPIFIKVVTFVFNFLFTVI